MTKVIGLTGGIGSGKSTVAKYLAELGAKVIYSDDVGHDAFLAGSPMYDDVVAEHATARPSGERLGEPRIRTPSMENFRTTRRRSLSYR